MASEAVKKGLWELEMQYWQAIKDKDADAAVRLSDNPCVVVGAQGVGVIDKKSLQGMLANAAYALNDYHTIGRPEIRLLTDDVAIVAYRIREDLTVDGREVTLDASEASTWVRRQNRWVCVLHTESITGDPFGRDRQQAH